MKLRNRKLIDSAPVNDSLKRLLAFQALMVGEQQNARTTGAQHLSDIVLAGNGQQFRRA